MNTQDLLNQADKNIREETQAVVDMLYEDVRNKYASLVGAINISVTLAYYYDLDETDSYNAKYNQIKNVFENKYFENMLKEKFAGFYEYLIIIKTNAYFRLTIGHDPVKNVFVKLP